jgi:hypothetical protein
VRLDLIVDELPVPLQRRRFHLDRAESRVKILPRVVLLGSIADPVSRSRSSSVNFFSAAALSPRTVT